MGKFTLFLKSNFYQSKFANTYIPARNRRLFLILTHWSYSKCKDILQKLNVYKIPTKEHQVVDRRDEDETSVS